MNPFYPFAILSWAVFWAIPGFVFHTIPTSALLAFLVLGVLMFVVARPVSNSYAERHPNLSQGIPRYKEIFKGLGIILFASFFFQLLHYGLIHG